MGAEAEEERREDIEERERERKLEDSLHGAARLGVDVHSYIVAARRYEKAEGEPEEGRAIALVYTAFMCWG